MKKIAYFIVATLATITISSCSGTSDTWESVTDGFQQYAAEATTLDNSSLVVLPATVKGSAKFNSTAQVDNILEYGLVASSTTNPMNGTFGVGSDLDLATGLYTAAIKKLTPETIYNVWAYTVSKSGQIVYSSNSVQVTTPVKQMVGYVNGTFKDCNGISYNVRLQKWNDETYVLVAFKGNAGYDLVFSVNDDGSINVENTLGQDSGYEIVKFSESDYDYLYVVDGNSGFSEEEKDLWFDEYDGTTGAENWGEFTWTGDWVTP